MADDAVEGASRIRLVQQVVVVLLGAGLVACAVIAGLQAPRDTFSGLTAVLFLSAIAAGIAVVPSLGRASISPSVIVVTLAAAFLGPASAAGCAVTAELVSARRLQTPFVATVSNLFASVGPALLEGNVIRWLWPHDRNDPGFYLVVALAAAIVLTLNFVIIATVYFPVFRRERTLTYKVFWEYTPAQALNIGLVVAGAGIYAKVGLPGIVFALLALFTFSYMAHLLERSRRRAEQYFTLSLGVLTGLMRALDIRDGRAARHAAAVAAFSREIAEKVGMTDAEQELAHTAGLLHDIGHFALSDAVHERDRTLTDKDWEDIWRHPELGAELLKDLGGYGPVAEIVLAHHERLDGRGYPFGLTAEEIPEISKIIAVAEVYDTLTAEDTYRTQKSSFEALTELRRVAGSQLDARYVEVLAGLLTGEGTEYRHATEADFDKELDMERRIREARSG